jgi:outer membrane receptor protein involved in Fe transport
MRRTPEFWLLNLTSEIPLSRRVSLLATVNNLTNEIQNDLSDPTTDYNWGPLAGRSWRAGLKVHLGG